MLQDSSAVSSCLAISVAFSAKGFASALLHTHAPPVSRIGQVVASHGKCMLITPCDHELRLHVTPGTPCCTGLLLTTYMTRHAHKMTSIANQRSRWCSPSYRQEHCRVQSVGSCGFPCYVLAASFFASLLRLLCIRQDTPLVVHPGCSQHPQPLVAKCTHALFNNQFIVHCMTSGLQCGHHCLWADRHR